MESIMPDSYAQFLAELKSRIQAAQLRAALAVNRELVLLYWQIGRDILARQHEQGWGAKVIDRLAADLRQAFPEMQGFLAAKPQVYARVRRSLARRAIVQQVACTIAVVPQLRAPRQGQVAERAGLVRPGQAIQHGWSRTSWSTRSRAASTAGKAQAITNFDGRSRRRSPTSPSKSSRTPTTSTS